MRRACRPKHLRMGRPHPDHIVESASLAAIAPPKIYVDLSALQARPFATPRVSPILSWPHVLCRPYLERCVSYDEGV